MELHLAVSVTSDLVHLEIHGMVVYDVDLPGAKLLINNLCRRNELKELIRRHVFDLATYSLLAGILLVYILEHLHVLLHRVVACLIVHLLWAEVMGIECVEVRHHMLLEGFNNGDVKGATDLGLVVLADAQTHNDLEELVTDELPLGVSVPLDVHA
jgi:hypothetical protein